eukprot:TRINITY_DN7454_c0_g1_i2.p1 TRINITY_DN7454_c0_g1~~TRINITY_DN7454_c0_g1_i2.p1  ORF type:complete len:294 (+),score=60.17 TRINITY_DN7454_c0_g1_i2:312-1193(+)
MVELDGTRLGLPRKEQQILPVPTDLEVAIAAQKDGAPPPGAEIKPLLVLERLSKNEKAAGKAVPISAVGGDSSGSEQVASQPSFVQATQDALGNAFKSLAMSALKAILQNFYKDLEGKLNVAAGSELLAALTESCRAGIPVLLGDQPAARTLARLSEAAGKVDMNQLQEALDTVPELGIGVAADDSPASLSAVLEGFRDQATTRRIRRAVRLGAPELFSALVDERDAYLADSLLAVLDKPAARVVAANATDASPMEDRRYKRIVATVGSIHVEGVGQRLVERAGLQRVDDCVY